MQDPLGVDTRVASFGWALELPRGAAAQVAARVVVAAQHTGAVVYDSGEVATAQPTHTNSGGQPSMALESDTVYNWTVAVRFADGGGSVSAPATFTTGQ